MFELLAAVVLSTTPSANSGNLPPDAVEGLSGLPVPRYASLASGKANMRTGPGERYPITWLYQRKGLPARVVKEYGIWREVVRSEEHTSELQSLLRNPYAVFC